LCMPSLASSRQNSVSSVMCLKDLCFYKNK
jgi:hypothetical protein